MWRDGKHLLEKSGRCFFRLDSPTNHGSTGEMYSRFCSRLMQQMKHVRCCSGSVDLHKSRLTEVFVICYRVRLRVLGPRGRMFESCRPDCLPFFAETDEGGSVCLDLNQTTKPLPQLNVQKLSYSLGDYEASPFLCMQTLRKIPPFEVTVMDRRLQTEASRMFFSRSHPNLLRPTRRAL